MIRQAPTRTRQSSSPNQKPQSSAFAALFALVAQRFIHRDLKSGSDVLRVMTASMSLVGGVLIILAVAVGLTTYLIDAQVPAAMV